MGRKAWHIRRFTPHVSPNLSTHLVFPVCRPAPARRIYFSLGIYIPHCHSWWPDEGQGSDGQGEWSVWNIEVTYRLHIGQGSDEQGEWSVWNIEVT